MRIKVCGMRDSGNIRSISDLQPDYMGFIFYPGSGRYFGNDFEVIRRIPENIKKAGVFVNEDPLKILEIATKCRLDLIQLHGSESPELCIQIRSAGYAVIKAIAVDDTFDFSLLSEYKNTCDYFLFDTKSIHHGGSGRKFNWDLIRSYDLDTPFFLGGGIGPGDAIALSDFSNEKFHAVDINSRFESKPGLKDVGLVEEFITSVRLQF